MGGKYRTTEERVKLYDEVMNLRAQGLGYKRITKIIKEKYGVSLNPGMICNWVKGRYHPLRRCNKLVMGPMLAYAVVDGSAMERLLAMRIMINIMLA